MSDAGSPPEHTYEDSGNAHFDDIERELCASAREAGPGFDPTSQPEAPWAAVRSARRH